MYEFYRNWLQDCIYPRIVEIFENDNQVPENDVFVQQNGAIPHYMHFPYVTFSTKFLFTTGLIVEVSLNALEDQIARSITTGFLF